MEINIASYREAVRNGRGRHPHHCKSLLSGLILPGSAELMKPEFPTQEGFVHELDSYMKMCKRLWKVRRSNL